MARAQLPSPELHAIYPTALQAGSTTDIVLKGVYLEGLQELKFSIEGINASAVLVPKSEFRRHQWQEGTRFSITVPGQTPPGPCEVRALSRYGLTNPRILTIVAPPSSLAKEEASHEPANAPLLSSGTVANGRFESDRIDYFRFQAGKGETIHLSATSEAIDSEADPTLLVMDAAGKILRKNRDYRNRDSLLSFTAPEDGTWTVGIHDFLYRGGAPYLFRIWKGLQLHSVLPPAVPPGQPVQATVFGEQANEGTKVTITAPDVLPKPLRASSPTDALTPAFLYRMEQSNTIPVGIIEPQPQPRTGDGHSTMASGLPASFYGYFQQKGENHRYRFPVRENKSYSISILGGSLQGRIDPYLVVERVETDQEGLESLKKITEGDDFSVESRNTFPDVSRDPSLSFQSDKDGVCQVTVLDQFQETGRSSAYAIRIAEAQPSFELIALLESELPDGKGAKPASANLRKGGSITMEVKAIRKEGMDQPIHLKAADLPGGVTFPETIIPSGQNSVNAVLRASRDATPGPARIGLIGRAGEGEKEITAPAVPAFVINPVTDSGKERVRTRVTEDFFLTVIEEDSPAALEITSTVPESVSLGEKLEIPLELSVIGPEVPDALTVDIVGLPGLKKSPTLAINPKKKTGSLLLNIKEDGNFKPNTGENTFLIRAVGTIKKYRHYPEGVTRLEEDLSHLEEIAKSASKEDESLQKRLAEERKSIESELKRAREIAKEKDVRFAVFTSPVTINILPAQAP